MRNVARRPERRTAGAWFVVSAAILGAAVALWQLRTSESTGTPRTRVRPVPIDVTPGHVDGTAAPVDEDSRGSGDEADARPGGFVVHVERRTDGAAVAGAEVLVWPEARSTSPSEEAPSVLRARAGDHGVATFDLPPEARGRRVVAEARAEGHVPGRSPAEVSADGTGAAVLRLEPSGSVRGVVRDSSGGPVVGVRVVALTAGMDPDSVSSWSRCDGSRVWSDAITDAAGCFECLGLRPGAVYTVTVSSDGWLARSPKTVVAASPAGHAVDVVADPVRVFRLRLRDPRSGAPVSQPHVSLSLADDHGLNRGRMAPARLWDGQRFRTTLSQEEDPPGVYTGHVVFRSADLVPERVRIDCDNLRGYRPFTTLVRARLPSLAWDGQVDDAAAVPESEGAVGELIVRELGDGAALLLKRRRVLRFSVGDAWEFRWGHPRGEREWEFSNLPVGEYAFSIGVSPVWSHTVRAVVRPGASTSISAEYGPVSAVAIRPVDSHEAEIHGYRLVIQRAQSGDAATHEFLYNGEVSDEWRAPDGFAVFPVEPGDLVVILLAPGFAYHRFECRVVTGEVVRVRAPMQEAVPE